MKDRFFLPRIPVLSGAVQPWADRLHLPVLPLHVHEVLFFAMLYTFVQVVVSPVLSGWLFPSYYPRHSRNKKANWDTHVVSLFQSVLINVMTLWTIAMDEERKHMDWQQRIWGYTGASGLIQAMAAGYFLWDLLMTLTYIDIFGLGLLAHAVSAFTVYAIGFRPFLNFYACTFILYELSTPFLNFHWFFDKLHMTGSRAQLYNGIALLVTFFSCRLVWGTYQSFFVYRDMWRAVHAGPAAPASAPPDADADMMAFATEGPIPAWLFAVYVASNLILNMLNWHWFFKMITAVRKRFGPPAPAAPAAARKAPGDDDDDAAAAAATGADGPAPAPDMRKRRSTIEEIVPDSEELREGTIQ